MARVRVLRVWFLSKYFPKNVDWNLPKKKNPLKLLHDVSVLVYITAKSHPRQKLMFPFFCSFFLFCFCQVFVAISVISKLPCYLLPIRHFLCYGDYMSSKYLSSTKLSRKHMPMNLLYNTSGYFLEGPAFYFYCSKWIRWCSHRCHQNVGYVVLCNTAGNSVSTSDFHRTPSAHLSNWRAQHTGG